MHLLLLGLLLAQQSQTVFRIEKNAYVPAVKACDEAATMISSNPRGAIERLDPILVNSKIRKIECRLRIEVRPSEYSRYSDFFPYQFRGRARINLAKTAEPEEAERLLRGAVGDLKKSVSKGLASSKTYQQQAEAALAKVRASMNTTPAPPPVVNPLTSFRPGWQRLIDQRKYRSAATYVKTQGKALTAEQRASFLKQTEDRCRTQVSVRMFEFRGRFALLRSVRDLTRMSGLEFATLFALPAPDELAVTTPDYDWARANLETLRKVQSRQAGGEALLKAAETAAPLVAEGENVWFVTAEALAYEGVRDKVQAAVDAAKDAPLAEREKRRSEGDALLATWKKFEAELHPQFRKNHPAVGRHRSVLEELLKGFPVVLAELDKVDLDACFAAGSPEKELAKAEAALRTMSRRSGIALESRRKLYTALVTAASLRLFLEGKNEAEVIGEVGAFRSALAAAGGPLDVKRFGPRIEKVFEKLR